MLAKLGAEGAVRVVQFFSFQPTEPENGRVSVFVATPVRFSVFTFVTSRFQFSQTECHSHFSVFSFSLLRHVITVILYLLLNYGEESRFPVQWAVVNVDKPFHPRCSAPDAKRGKPLPGRAKNFLRAAQNFVLLGGAFRFVLSSLF